MPAYVDPIRHYPAARWQVKHWCHCTADTREELHELAERAGIPLRLFQDHPYRWHYDLTPDMREEAVRLGAEEITTREMVRAMRRRLGTGARR